MMYGWQWYTSVYCGGILFNYYIGRNWMKTSFKTKESLRSEE